MSQNHTACHFTRWLVCLFVYFVFREKLTFSVSVVPPKQLEKTLYQRGHISPLLHFTICYYLFFSLGIQAINHVRWKNYKFTECYSWVLTLRKCSSKSFSQVPAYIFGDGQDTQFVPFRHSPDIQSRMEFSLIRNLTIFPLYQPKKKKRVQRMRYRCLWQRGMFIRASVVAPF